jgi:hypothetical protein
MTTFVKLVDRQSVEEGKKFSYGDDFCRRLAGTTFAKAVSNLHRPSSAPSNRAVSMVDSDGLMFVPATPC